MAINDTQHPLEITEQQATIPFRDTQHPIEVTEQQITIPYYITQFFIEVSEIIPTGGKFSKKIFWRRFFSGRRRDLRAGIMSRIHR